MPSRFESVLAKYNWAKQHVADFEAASDAFRYKNPHSFGRDTDAATGEFVYQVKSVPDVPEPLRLKLGDAIHNLRSTLDHAAYAVVDAGTVKPDSHTYFPVFDTSEAYKTLRNGRIPGLGQYCYEVFDRIQPYQGGWGHWVWELHRLDIINKHRLVLAVSTVNVAQVPIPRQVSPGGTKITSPAAKLFGQMITGRTMGPPLRAVQVGDELGRFLPTEEHENMGFAFDVMVDESEVIPGVNITGLPAPLMLGIFSSRVFDVIGELARFM